ncbi:hypothetical protein [Metamycoplasma neophronis]|uniref:Smr domain-containing protein n=1 Tax=Metamycoplasma neophronis TaxID=872983 RepID=A0ABY2Z065_9BACT|nr:hypothetical protein [Metamycoplasma neophronis]TPR54277.1 hypothetical protein FJR74_00655 [Metamycoplasma neophronis]
MNFRFFPLVLDLHGYDTIEATAATLNALKEFEEDEYMEYIDIIVGIGTGAVKFVVEDLLEEECFPFSYLNKNGSKIRVYKRK